MSTKHTPGPLPVKVERTCPRCRTHAYHRGNDRGIANRIACVNCGHEWTGRIRKDEERTAPADARKEHEAAFMAAVKGATAYQVAAIVQRMFTPGSNWRGCGKGYMAECYASAKEGSHPVFPQMGRVDLKALSAAIAKAVEGAQS